MAENKDPAEDIVDPAAGADQEPEDHNDADPEPEQDPIKKELNRVSKKGQDKTELEKAMFARQKIDERITTLKGEHGIEDEPLEADENAPMTVGMYAKLQREQATKTALNLASEQIEDEDERNLTLHHLQNTIKPSGNPTEDLRNARALVNSARNSNIAEEVARKLPPKSRGNGGGAPARREEAFEPTKEEASMMKAPFNLTKEEVIAARKASER